MYVSVESEKIHILMSFVISRKETIVQKLLETSKNSAKTPQSTIQKAAKLIMRSVLWVFGIVLLLTVLLWFWIGDKITDGVFAFYERTFWMTKTSANVISFILIIAFSGTLTWTALCAVVGRRKVLTASIAISVIVGLVAFDYHTRKEIFAPGKDLTYLCSPSSKGAEARIRKTPIDPESKKPCKEIDPSLSSIAQEIIDGKFKKPERLPLESVNREDLVLSENGLSIVYKSAVSQNGLPILFSGAGWDPYLTVADFLKPATLDDVEKIKAFLRDQKKQKEVEQKTEAEQKALKEKQDAEAKAVAEKAARLKAEKEEIEYKKGVYKNVTELVSDLKQEKQKLEEEERRSSSSHTTQKSKAPRRGDDNILTVHRGMYVVSMTNLVNVYVDGRKVSIPFTSEAFEELHSQGKKIQIATEGCWFCEEWVTLGAIVKNNKKRISEIEEALRMYARDLEQLRKDVPELGRGVSQPPVTKAASPLATQTVENQVVITINFKNGKPPKTKDSFSYSGVETYTVKNEVEIGTTKTLCGKVKFQLNNDWERDVCELNGLKMSAGDTYTITVPHGMTVYSRNY